MKITVLKQSRSLGLRKFHFSEIQVISILVSLLALPVLTGWLGYRSASSSSEEQPLPTVAIASMRALLDQQQLQLAESKKQAQIQLDALTSKIGLLQSEFTRINALGRRVAVLAKVNEDEFDFSQSPGIGGPSEIIGNQSEYSASDIFRGLDDFTAQLNDSVYQLEVLEAVLLNKEIKAERRISGRPIKKGWESSYYGTRTDPFHGKPSWHGGMDFAGKQGSDVIATAAGVVTFSAKRSNYGDFIEISHGGGLTTRYAHNSELLVAVGDIVNKGQVIAKMGSEGRSTGPHVHYEILKDGKTLNPARFVNRR